MTSWLPFSLPTKVVINVEGFSNFYNSFICKNVLITKSVQKHTDNKLFASFEPEVPTHFYKEVLGIKT